MSWKKVKLGDFLKVRDNRYKPNAEAIANLKRIDKIDFSGEIFVSYKHSNTDMILVKKGDLVISGINVEKGAMAVYTGEEDLTATIHYSSYIFEENKIDIDFLKSFLKSIEFKNALKEQVPGGIKTEIKPKHLLSLIIEIPEDVKDQREIVKILQSRNSKVDFISSEIAYQITLVKKLRQQLLQDAVQGNLVEQNQQDDPASELLKKIKAEKAKLFSDKKLKKEKELPPIKHNDIPFEIPDNWVWCRLGEISINLDGQRIPVSQSERERKEKKYDYYGASGVIDKIDNYTHDGKFLLIGEDGANLIAKSTPIAFIAEGKFWVNNHAHVLDFIDDVMIYYMTYCLNSIDIKPYITGGFQPKLNQGNLNSILIPLPPITEQKLIVQKLDELMKYCNDLEESIKQSESENEKLLQQVLREALRK